MTCKLILNFVPGTTFIRQETMLACPDFKFLKLKPNKYNKYWSQPGQDFVPINFQVSIIFEKCVLSEDMSYLQKFIDQSLERFSIVIQQTLVQHFEIPDKKTLVVTWHKHGEFNQMETSVRYSTKCLLACAIIHKSIEVDFWMECTRNLMGI